jgi:putative toxin-antitoxin system antitoxin component (TIGR02293 family)
MTASRRPKLAARRARPASPRKAVLEYVRGHGVEAFAERVRAATPLEIVGAEKQGVPGRLLKDLAATLAIPTARFYDIVGIPKATAEKKAANDEVIGGAGGQAALGVVKLLGIAREIVARSTAPGARQFDVAKWLGEWIERPQPALGGRRPAELLDTPTGFEIVARTLGALESGAYV